MNTLGRSTYFPCDRRTSPLAVVRDPNLTIEDKRAVLASWASDRRAVPDKPNLRRLDDSSIVEIDDILDALKLLDEMTSLSTADLLSRTWSSREPRTMFGHAVWRYRNDDDDDPPTPSPAAVRPRPPVLSGGVAAVAVAA